MSDDIPTDSNIHSTTNEQEDAAAEVAMSVYDYLDFITTMSAEGEVNEKDAERYATRFWFKLQRELPEVFATTTLVIKRPEPSAPATVAKGSRVTGPEWKPSTDADDTPFAVRSGGIVLGIPDH